MGVPRRAPKKPDFSAQVRAARQTVAAPKAGSARVDRNPLTDLNVRHVLAYFNHFSGYFMTKHHRFTHGEIAHASFVVIMQVGSSNTPGPKSHQHFAFLRPRYGTIFNFQVFSPVNDACLHKQ